MSISTKHQEYTYSIKSTSLVFDDFCNRKIWLYQIPPENALAIKNLYCRFKIRFDAGIASGSRVIEKIGIMNADPTAPNSNTFEGTYNKYYELNLTADANREIDVTIDLSQLLNESDVGHMDLQDTNETNRTLVFIEFPIALSGTTNMGDILLWKIDALYTTQEIR